MFFSVHRLSVGQVEQHLSTSFNKKKSCAGMGGSAPVARPTSFPGAYHNTVLNKYKTVCLRTKPKFMYFSGNK